MRRVPLQYLTGSAHWRDLVLAVGPGVLIPRPETELLIEYAQEVLCISDTMPTAYGRLDILQQGHHSMGLTTIMQVLLCIWESKLSPRFDLANAVRRP